MIGKVEVEIFIKTIRDLMDSSLEEGEINKINEVINSIPGVTKFHDLHTRRIGGEILIDVHILVDPGISFTEGHNISESVRHKVKEAFKNIQDILVNVDAEEGLGSEVPYFATREELSKLTVPVTASLEHISNTFRMQVHYLEGKNIVELFIQVGEKNHTRNKKKF